MAGPPSDPSTAPTRRLRRVRRLVPRLRRAVIGGILAAAALFAAEIVFDIALSGSRFFTRMPGELKVVAGRGLFDQRVAGGTVHSPRLLLWAVGMAALYAAGRVAAKGAGSLLRRLGAAVPVVVAYAAAWFVAALTARRFVIEEHAWTLLWPLLWGAIFAGLGALAAGSTTRTWGRWAVAALSGARRGAVVIVALASLALLVDAVSGISATERFFGGKHQGVRTGVVSFVARAPTAWVNVERLGTVERVGDLAPLSPAKKGVSLVGWPEKQHKGGYGPLRYGRHGGKGGSAPWQWWLLLAIPAAAGISAGRGAGRGGFAPAMLAGVALALLVLLVLWAGSPVPGSFQGVAHVRGRHGAPAGPPYLLPFAFNLLWLVPFSAVGAFWVRRSSG